MELKIRTYQPSDYSTCRSLWAELTRYHREIYKNETIGGDDPGGGIDPYLKNERLHGPWVAIIDDQMVGFAGLLAKGKEAELEPVIVSRQFRHQGIGKMLVDFVIQEANNLGVKFLDIRSVARNVDAMVFFIDQGFDILGHVSLFMDLSDPAKREWESGITIHSKILRY